MALETAETLKKEHPEHPRSLTAFAKLFSHWDSLSKEDKLKAFKAKTEEDLAPVQKRLADLGYAGDFAKTFFEARKGNLEVVLQYLKLTKDYPNAEQVAIEALAQTPQNRLNIKTLVSVHQTLKKVKGFKDESFKQKAKELFPLSTYFASA